MRKKLYIISVWFWVCFISQQPKKFESLKMKRGLDSSSGDEGSDRKRPALARSVFLFQHFGIFLSVFLCCFCFWVVICWCKGKSLSLNSEWTVWKKSCKLMVFNEKRINKELLVAFTSNNVGFFLLKNQKKWFCVILF